MQVLLVLSAEGREATLLQTLHALRWRGGDFDGLRVVVYVGEGDPPEVGEDWALWHVARRPAGSTLDMMAALDLVVAEAFGPAVERLLYFEDDVEPVTNAVTFMSEVEVPDRVAFLVGCDTRGFGGTLPAILEVAPRLADVHLSNQALVIPGRTLRFVTGRSLPLGTDPNCADVVFGRLATADPMPPRWGIIAPSLVQHVGARSLANPGHTLAEVGRTAPNFPGVHWDALGPEALFQVGRLVES